MYYLFHRKERPKHFCINCFISAEEIEKLCYCYHYYFTFQAFLTILVTDKVLRNCVIEFKMPKPSANLIKSVKLVHFKSVVKYFS